MLKMNTDEIKFLMALIYSILIGIYKCKMVKHRRLKFILIKNKLK